MPECRARSKNVSRWSRVLSLIENVRSKVAFWLCYDCRGNFLSSGIFASFQPALQISSTPHLMQLG